MKGIYTLLLTLVLLQSSLSSRLKARLTQDATPTEAQQQEQIRLVMEDNKKVEQEQISRDDRVKHRFSSYKSVSNNKYNTEDNNNNTFGNEKRDSAYDKVSFYTPDYNRPNVLNQQFLQRAQPLINYRFKESARAKRFDYKMLDNVL